MAAYALPVPMRKIAAGALSLDYEDALIGLGRVAPSTLSQIIPSAVSRQRKWLRAYQAFRDRLRHSCTDPNAHATWAATRIAEHRVSWGAAADVADFVAMGDQPINSALLVERQAAVLLYSKDKNPFDFDESITYREEAFTYK